MNIDIAISCCLYRKGKNFRANHNTFYGFSIYDVAVAYIAKVRILEQITTDLSRQSYYKGCCLYRKGKNFRANHNKITEKVTIYMLLLISQS